MQKAASTLLVLLVHQVAAAGRALPDNATLSESPAAENAGVDGSVDRVVNWLTNSGAELGNVKAVTVQTGPKGWMQAERGVRVERNIEAGDVIMTGIALPTSALRCSSRRVPTSSLNLNIGVVPVPVALSIDIGTEATTLGDAALELFMQLQSKVQKCSLLCCIRIAAAALELRTGFHVVQQEAEDDFYTEMLPQIGECHSLET